MKIKGRVYHLVNTPANHDTPQEYLRYMLEAAFVAPDSGNGGLKLELKRKRNPRGKISCITLTNVDIDRDVALAIEHRLEQLLGMPFYIHTSASSAKLFERGDYRQRLDAVVAPSM